MSVVAGAVEAGSRPPCRIALAQLCSSSSKDANLEQCSRLAQEAAVAGCQLLALPECFAFMGAQKGEAQAAAEPLTGPLMRKYQEIARQHGLWLSLGGFPESPPEGEKTLNAHVVVDAVGEIAAVYRKIHLFDAPFTGLVESEQSIAGSEVVSCESPVGKLGLTVCYDIRFPELFQRLRFGHGCEVMLVPSAFTMKTGEAHWELLMRARAVECQCFVVSAAQAGLHNDGRGNGRTSWGHSIAVDPWGKVLAEMDGQETGLRVVDLDFELLAKVRREMPLESQRRYDVYGGGAAAEGQKS